MNQTIIKIKLLAFFPFVCILSIFCHIDIYFVLFRRLFATATMVQPTISIRTVTPADIKYKEEAAKVVNAAYRSEGQFVKFLF